MNVSPNNSGEASPFLEYQCVYWPTIDGEVSVGLQGPRVVMSKRIQHFLAIGPSSPRPAMSALPLC